ncbi:unnamed protein product [Schistocephalus solidus]|uniref:Immediate early response 3-interacting protein 1 n=1 Tax=Schistocephalus solidus TaxID=70667 RepID=A0A183TA20_SCHSO|nr:unnamed protein product [Schistocephalus solidus]
MAFGLYTIFESIVLLLNAVCILNEQRFLAKRGWTPASYEFVGDATFKSRLLTFITSVRTVMRSLFIIFFITNVLIVPLIGLNSALIIFKLVLG